MHGIRLVTLGIALVAASVAMGQAHGDNWPAWRGPSATGASLTAQPPITWSESHNIRWKVKLPGQGSSSPVVWGDRIFILTAIETDQKVEEVAQVQPEAQPQAQPEGRRGRGRRGRGGGGFRHGTAPPETVHQFALLCIDRNSGDILWQKIVREEVPHEGHHPTSGFASYSPVTDGEHVWVNFGSRGVHCYDIDGNHVWSKELGKLEIRLGFGEGSSPALAGDALIVVMDHQGQSKIAALNKLTGDILWQQDRDEQTTWATPLVVEVDGRLQVVTCATASIRSYDVATGDLIWQAGGMTPNAIPSPVHGYGMVFCTSGFRGSSLQAIELGHTGDLTDSDAIRWQVNRDTPYVPSPLLYDGRLYVLKSNSAIVACYDARSGKEHFARQRLEGMREVYASPVGAGGRIYFVGRDGSAAVIKAGDTFEVLAVNQLDEGIDASPAIVGNEMFLRGQQHLYCIAEN